jgi:hypothetical protein
VGLEEARAVDGAEGDHAAFIGTYSKDAGWMISDDTFFLSR